MIDTEFVKNTKLLEKGRDLKDWYIFRDEKHYGPFSYDDVSNFIKSDLIQMRHHIWRPGFDVWMRVEDLSELSCLQDSKAPRKNLTDNDFESLFTEEIAVTEDMDFDAPESPNAQQVDINTKNKNSLIVLSVIFSVAFSGLLYVFMNSKDDLYSFARLPDVQKSKLEIISESPIKGSADIRFQSYLSKMNTGDPVIVFSTNLPKDTEIEYNLKGVEGTLVGLHRYADSKIAYVPSDKIFESKPLRRSTGEYIPAGVYSLFVSCTKCENEVSFKDKIEYYPKGKIQYKKDINQFNESVRYNAKLELGELEQITTNVKQQFDETRKAFEKEKIQIAGITFQDSGCQIKRN